MAEESKPKIDPVNEMIFLIVGLFILAAVLVQLEEYIASLDTTAASTVWERIVNFFMHGLVPFTRVMLIVVGVFASVGIVYNLNKLRAINIEEQQIYGISNARLFGQNAPGAKNDKWERVLTHINSVNSAEWRLAIIEADVMLEELLRTTHQTGESVGEMLKATEPSDMLTLDAAWEAHKVRNKVAHAGGDFNLNEREAKRVISLYESVFKEFHII
jgi:hypothetical protein